MTIRQLDLCFTHLPLSSESGQEQRRVYVPVFLQNQTCRTPTPILPAVCSISSIAGGGVHHSNQEVYLAGTVDFAISHYITVNHYVIRHW